MTFPHIRFEMGGRSFGFSDLEDSFSPTLLLATTGLQLPSLCACPSGLLNWGKQNTQGHTFERCHCKFMASPISRASGCLLSVLSAHYCILHDFPQAQSPPWLSPHSGWSYLPNSFLEKIGKGGKEIHISSSPCTYSISFSLHSLRVRDYDPCYR